MLSIFILVFLPFLTIFFNISYVIIFLAGVGKEIREMTIKEEPEEDAPGKTSDGNSDNDSNSGNVFFSFLFLEITFVFFIVDNETVEETRSKPKRVEFPDTQVKVPLLGEK